MSQVHYQRPEPNEHGCTYLFVKALQKDSAGPELWLNFLTLHLEVKLAKQKAKTAFNVAPLDGTA